MVKKEKKVKAEPAAVAAVVQESPPGPLMDLVESFLSDHSFTTAHKAFKQQRATNGWQAVKKVEAPHHHSLVSVFQTWQTSFTSPDGGVTTIKTDKVTKVTSSSDSDSSSDSSSDSESDEEDIDMADVVASASSSSESSSDSESDTDSESDEELPTIPTPSIPASAAKILKRKAPSSDSSSSSSSDSESESESESDSSDDQRPQVKKQKLVDESASESDSDSSSSEESDDSSDSESESDASEAAKVPLPESGSSSSEDSSSDDSSSDSDDSESEGKASAKIVKKKATNLKDKSLNDPSDSSVTLEKTSPEFRPTTDFPPLPPDPFTSRINNRGSTKERKPNVPFSRIPQDIKVDEKFASNDYVPNDYSQRAHQDLIVTKGKGFTKEKNKKKRGSYRGGMIDISEKKGIKFED